MIKSFNSFITSSILLICGCDTKRFSLWCKSCTLFVEKELRMQVSTNNPPTKSCNLFPFSSAIEPLRYCKVMYIFTIKKFLAHKCWFRRSIIHYLNIYW